MDFADSGVHLMAVGEHRNYIGGNFVTVDARIGHIRVHQCVQRCLVTFL